MVKKTNGDTFLSFLTECESVGFLEIAEDGWEKGGWDSYVQ